MPSLWSLMFILGVRLAAFAMAETSNNTTNATITDVVGWQAGPQTRGTFTLVWSCVLTIFACTWTVQHLNVPGRKDSAWTRFQRRTKWMFITIVFPEFIFSKAVCDLRQALFDLEQFGKHLRKINKSSEWTIHYNEVWSHRWSWDVKYPPHKDLLYRLLRLRTPSSEQIYFEKSAHKDSDNKGLFNLLRRLSLMITIQPQRTAPTTQAENGRPSISTRRPSFERSRTSFESGSSHWNPRRPSYGIRLTQTPGQWHTIQRWTIFHSYYAQMGGLLMPDSEHEKQNETDEGQISEEASYIVATAWRLTCWNYDEGEHPLKGLILDEERIHNMSKADWFLKAIAIIQVLWLLLNTGVRGISRLHVTQLEIATVAFAIMAGFTYVANWWKPKDISEATVLHHYCDGKWTTPNHVRLYWLWLWSPTKALSSEQLHKKLKRVRNDTVRMKGRVSFITVILAISSLFFGGFHCIAWNFQFPSYIELILWRIVCLVSAVLPAVTLAISSLLSHLSVVDLNPKAEDKNRRLTLKVFSSDESSSNEWWEHMLYPVFDEFSPKARVAFINWPEKTSTDWEKDPPQEVVNQSNDDSSTHDLCLRFIDCFRDLRMTWDEAFVSHESKIADFNDEFIKNYDSMREIWEDKKMKDFWSSYEDFVNQKVKISTDSRTMACVDHMHGIWVSGTLAESIRMNRRVLRTAKVVSIFSGILYTTSRLVAMVLLFTSLRVTPIDTYQITPWVNFLPNIS